MNINKNNKGIIINLIFMKIRKINFDKYLQIFDKYPREYFVFIFFFIFAVVIISKVFDYTVSKYSFYKDLADRQQKTQTSIPVTRGSIYSNNDKGKVLATSVDLNDLAIDPAVEGDKNKLKAFLVDIVYKQNCYLKGEKNCYKDMSKFLHVLEIPDFKFEESYIKGIIGQKLEKDINKKKLTNVLIADTLSQEEINKITKLSLTGIYINGLNVYANPEEIIDPKIIASSLSDILQEDETSLAYRMRKRDLRYIPIISKLSISLYDEINKKINDEKESIKRGFLTKDKGIRNFIILTPNPNRFYPERFLASQVLGFLDNGGIGRYGIEGYFNNLLKGKEGSLITKKDTMGRVIDPSTLKEEEIRVAGANITLTIDRNIQKKVEEELEKGVEEFRANKGSVTVMNPKTGEILAMASYPTFDPNEPGDVYEIEKVSYGKYPNPTDLLGKTVLVEDNISGDELLYDNKKIKLRVATREELYN
ncbi:MAG: penicillin-binding transpeptidase domain-containing protein, partial [Candidatus Gracilibacteria bacterium]|nr:penicillin-binding transpeptidase domain-containing protein [Candidatus Gracilibacteria bacterium]